MRWIISFVFLKSSVQSTRSRSERCQSSKHAMFVLYDIHSLSAHVYFRRRLLLSGNLLAPLSRVSTRRMWRRESIWTSRFQLQIGQESLVRLRPYQRAS